MKTKLFFAVCFFTTGLLKAQISKPATHKKVASAFCTAVKITSSSNGYNYGGSFNTAQQTGLNYNPDLNTVLFVSPVSADWHFAGKSQWAIQATWHNLTNNTWDSAIIYNDSLNIKRPAFSGGVMYNPTGNVSLANAYIVGTGPWQDSLGVWKGVWYNAIKPQHQFIPANDNNTHLLGNLPFDTTAFLNADMQQAGNKIVVAGILNNPNDSTKNTQRGGVIGRADFSGGLPNWSSDTLIPGFYKSLGKGYMSNSFRIAFGPDQQTGYAVFIGRTNYAVVNNTCHDTTGHMMAPVVYKTTNGGATWTSVLANTKNLAYEHPECLKNVFDPVTHLQLSNFSFFYSPYGLEHGIDLTVDVNGVLHLVGVVGASPYNGNHPDSLTTFKYNKQWDYSNYHPLIWDFMTDGTDWNTLFVDSILTSPVGYNPALDTTASYGLWKGKQGYLGYGARIQVARSVDGKVLFYSWADSDPNVLGTNATGATYNSNPSVLMKAYNVITNMVSATNSSGTYNCYFPVVSDIAIGTYGSGSMQVPFVYQNARVTNGLIFDGTKPVDYYESCATFNLTSDIILNAQIFNPPNVCTSIDSIYVGIDNQNNLDDRLSIYPNPVSNSLYIAVNNVKINEVNIYDVLGKEINYKILNVIQNNMQIDASSLSNGVYFIYVKTSKNSYTKKFIVQR